mmetsp:Transcript_7810/g.16309  ORF Transcript_7810/g.16309 Transcript_7810/m.16309 type:complete len:185 (-) Transcript_7810:5-559(-)|eukprot:CAMPEP_0182453184 /NCGR_PEP_ID=MMETSP1319-20130603/353_1 /TAXON_ID=172717 /ORGANISM="Bolidomonas pacifica, Strain RCC208" /LENGTH=184 /DNA_ID=CAMNT_0024651083 /DNA_START=306 /DNA_END=860 /DNA_ORIENTATION=-
MFYVKLLTHSLTLDPIHFGPNLHSTITKLTKEACEGRPLSHYGYVVHVIDVSRENMRAGVVEYDTGAVCYDVKYEALIFRPFKNEVLDANVAVVNQLGFFCKVGPLKVFVSKHLFPPDLNGVSGGSYDASSASWVSEDGEVRIREGCGVRCRVIGTTVEEGNVQGVGSINDEFLGLIDNGDLEG